MKKDAGEGTPGLNTCSFIAQAVSPFGEPTPAAPAFEEPGLRPAGQPMRKPGTAGGRARYVEVGGSGGNGWRQRRPPAVGGRKRPAVAVAGWSR